MTLIELALAAFATLLTGAVSILWNKADGASKIADSNRLVLTHMSKHLDRTDNLAQRLSSLEASVNVEIKNLSVSIKRMESALLRIDQNARNRTH